MDTSLHEVWTAAQGSPFIPAIGKDSQFTVAFGLLVLGILIAGAFTLSRPASTAGDGRLWTLLTA
jgi:cell cycle checkpoint protein